jgi:hypothetical protein
VRAKPPIRALPLLFFVLLYFPLTGRSAEPQDAPYLDSLLDDAHRLRLSEDPYWHILLHYKGGLPGFRSLVDDPRFFLAENGKHDPAAELDATLRAFFQPEPEYDKPAACRFVGRFEWLKEKLVIDETCLPVPRCEPFDELLVGMKPNAITLIFPASHMNSPASMYGHTLLTIRNESGSDLLAHAVNYAAQTTDSFGPFYIVKGLFGSYKGYFSILPYYAKLQEYSDVNDRDIWEYTLAFGDEEIRRLLAHIYEMQEIYADYYFFSENCSYDLLFLLDAARPGLDLTDQCASWVIPVDTVREVKKAGLIRDAVYRPSRSTKIKALMATLPKDGRKDALAIIRGELVPEEYVRGDAPTLEKMRVLDLASDYLQYVYADRGMTEGEFTDRFRKTLTARSALGKMEESKGPPISVPHRPDEGHHSARASVGLGLDEDRVFEEFRVRPAYHTLLDNGAGYNRGSQIVFMNIVLRYFSEEERLELEQLELIDILSVAPRDELFKHMSWKIRTDFFRRSTRNDEDHLVYRFNPGFGRATESRILGLCHAMIETDLHVGGALDPNYSIGAGASVGVVKNLTRFWTLQLRAEDIYHALGDTENRIAGEVRQNFQINVDMSISVEFMGDWNDHDDRQEGVVRWNVFF